MTAEAPPFWWERPDWRAWALYPASAIYGRIAAHRMRTAPREQVDLPVLCVGNFTVGGSGKTPVAIALAKTARTMGRSPGFLSRGYGGSFSHPHLVDADRDTAREVGDEPLLLANEAPVAISPDRAAAARLLARKGCDFLIMDDGFQSARIRIDFALIVVDARHGVGNGHVIPGGPLRAPLTHQLRFADAVLRMGTEAAAEPIVRSAARAGKPIFHAVARPVSAKGIAGRRFLGFAGIGHPDRFFDSVAAAGGVLVLGRTFADHHAYTSDDIDELIATAGAGELDLITTSKDAVRLRGLPAASGLLQKLHVLDVEVNFDGEDTAPRIISETIAAWRRRRFANRPGELHAPHAQAESAPSASDFAP